MGKGVVTTQAGNASVVQSVRCTLVGALLHLVSKHVQCTFSHAARQAASVTSPVYAQASAARVRACGPQYVPFTRWYRPVLLSIQLSWPLLDLLCTAAESVVTLQVAGLTCPPPPFE